VAGRSVVKGFRQSIGPCSGWPRLASWPPSALVLPRPGAARSGLSALAQLLRAARQVTSGWGPLVVQAVSSADAPLPVLGPLAALRSGSACHRIPMVRAVVGRGMRAEVGANRQCP
jgi:hypothetical protein